MIGMIGKRVSFRFLSEQEHYGIVVDVGSAPGLLRVYRWEPTGPAVLNIYRDEITGIEE